MLRLYKTILILFISTASLLATPLEQLQQDAHLIKNSSMLQNFYKNQGNQAMWLSEKGIRGAKVMKLLKYVHSDATLDSRGNIYKEAKRIKKNLEQKHSYVQLQQLELQLTSLYYDFLQHAIYGEIDWKSFESHLEGLKQSKIDSNWVRYPLKFDLVQLMAQDNIGLTLQQVTPKQYGYKKLLTALSKLYSVKWKGGWGIIPPSNSLKVGSSGAIVSQLRTRLSLSGDYQGCSVQVLSTKFDNCLSVAVKRFQKRHGLTADGVVGKGTKKLLNISVNDKIRTVLLNLDRIKWLPRQSAERYLFVNIPEYKLHYMYYNQEVKNLKVIVGDTTHPTPIFANKVSYITLNPYWKLPEGIVRKEVVPAMVKNPNYITKQGLVARETWEENSTKISLSNIQWSDYLDGQTKFPYRLMQPPGPRNALGKIKFKFPNNFAVYLHDTPTKHLFSKKRRAFSHGCIRLHKPMELLESLSSNDFNIDLGVAKSTLKGKNKKELHLDNKIPISLTYLTVWVNANNELTFGDDIYNYDAYQQRNIK